MALEVYWYDFFVFGIVAIAVLGSLWVIWKKEGGSGNDDNTLYESLLVSGGSDRGHVYVSALPKGHISTSQLWTSCWKGVPPIWLLATRFGSFLALAGFLTWDFINWDEAIFVYYTEWTFTLVMIYFALGTIVSAHGCWVLLKEPSNENGAVNESQRRDLEESRIIVNKETIKLQSHYAQEEMQRRAGFWGYLMQILYQTCGGAVMLTDTVFWFVIVPFLSADEHLQLDLLMGFMHSVNIVFLLLDASLNSLPFPLFRFSYFVLWTCTYAIFQWILHACGFSWWPYPFLELDTPWAPLLYFIMAVIHIPCYGIFALIVKAKTSFLPRFFPHAFVRAF